MHIGTFLTGKSRFEQTDIEGLWKTQDNLLYLDENGLIYLTPRYFITDGYTIPSIVAWIAGGKMQYDTRCSTQHDFECKYKKVIIVNLSLLQLRKMKLLREKNGMTVCDNIPKRFLKIKDTSFFETNLRFQRMLKASGMHPIRRWTLFFGTCLNLAWFWTKNTLNRTYIYREEI